MGLKSAPTTQGEVSLDLTLINHRLYCFMLSCVCELRSRSLVGLYESAAWPQSSTIRVEHGWSATVADHLKETDYFMHYRMVVANKRLIKTCQTSQVYI